MPTWLLIERFIDESGVCQTELLSDESELGDMQRIKFQSEKLRIH